MCVYKYVSNDAGEGREVISQTSGILHPNILLILNSVDELNAMQCACLLLFFQAREIDDLFVLFFGSSLPTKLGEK